MPLRPPWSRSFPTEDRHILWHQEVQYRRRLEETREGREEERGHNVRCAPRRAAWEAKQSDLRAKEEATNDHMAERIQFLDS